MAREPQQSPTRQQPPARQQATASFKMIPLTEPVLAPPAEEEWDRTSRHHAERSFSPQPRRNHVTQQPFPGHQRLVAADGPESEAAVASTSSSPSELLAEEMPFEDLFPADDLFPDDMAGEDTQPELIDDGLFLLPQRTPARLSDAGPQGAATAGRPAGVASTRSHRAEPKSGLSSYTGHRLNYSAFPSDSSQGTVAQPGRLFVEDERAIDPSENLDIDPGTLISSSFRPSGTDTVRDTQADFHAALAGSPRQQIVTRDGFGLKGFCPVALRDRRVLEDGRVAYMSYYAGKSYFFSSSQAKAAFDDNPRRYAPAADGYDVTRTAITGEVHEGSLDHAVWYKDRLYLFDSAETLKTFMALPSAMSARE